MIDFPHPVFTSFIFPLLSLCILFEVLALFMSPQQWRTSVAVTIVCVLLCTVISYYTGFNEFEKLENLNENQKALVENHQVFGKFFLISLLPTILFSILRLYNESLVLRILFILFFLLSFLLSMFTSHKGGELVFRHGIGVNTASYVNEILK